MFNGKHLRLGLCCIFKEEPISFKTHRAVHMSKLGEAERVERISTTVLHNSSSLLRALSYCHNNGIGSFRVNSSFLPLKTHPKLGYSLNELSDVDLIKQLLSECRKFSKEKNIRLTMHPDQFTLLSSPKKEVTHNSIAELEYHAELAELIGADVIILHGGGAYGDKKSALSRLEDVISSLSSGVRERLALENDDRIYTPRDLLQICRKTELPFVYDVHHHRCLPDGMNEIEATQRAVESWNREPLFHISSPREGWGAYDRRSHHDYINPADFPGWWRNMDVTVEVEAKAKELAVARMLSDLAQMSKVA